MAENYDTALEQLQAHGLVVSSIDTSGRIVRVDCEDRPGKKHGWYVAHEITLDDGRVFIVGRYGDLRAGEGGQGLHGTGQAIDITGIKLSRDEREQVKARRAEQRQKVEHQRAEIAAEAAQRAASIWPKLPEEGSSPYLQRKHVRAWGLRFSRGSVVVPVRTARGELVGLQFIDGDGQKRFLTGTAKKGAWHWVGGEPGEAGVLAIAEGYATAATIHEATGWHVACAFDAGNLGPVLEALRKLYPRRTIVVCGDEDHETKGNPGRTKATALAERYALPLAMPTFREPAGKTDWNDAHVEQGLDAVRVQLEAALVAGAVAPPAGEVIGFDLHVLLEHYVVIHGTSLVYDGRRSRLMPVAALNLSAGKDLVKRWLDHADRKLVNEEDVVFNPARTPSERPQVNLFTGMELAPSREGSCSRLIGHLHLLCGERDRLFEWVLKWIAYPLQHPGTKMATAIVMYGFEGTGKNLFWETVLEIYGRWGVLIGQEEIESSFNGWLSAKLFAVADEVVSRQELRHLKGRLKKLITGQRVMINEKNQPVREERNSMNIVFLSNEDEPLRIDPGDRRYCAIRCDEVQDAAYFEALGAEVANGGAAALYQYLLDVDLEDFTPWTRPYETDERGNLMQAASSPAVRFWHDWEEEELPLPYCSCRAQDLYQAFRAWCAMTGERFVPNDTAFGVALRPYEGVWFKKDRPRIVGADQKERRPKCYVVPEAEATMQASVSDQVAKFADAVEDYVTTARKMRL